MTHKLTREDIRKAIIASARHIAEKENWQAVTVRRVASDIHYAAPVVYEHFANKDDLLVTIATEGYGQLGHMFQEAFVTHDDPAKRLHEIGKAYWQFAMSEPQLYELMNGRGGITNCDSEEFEQAAKQCLAITMDAIRLLLGPDTTHEQVHLQAVSLWALMHGLIALVASSQVTHEEAKMVLENALRNFIQQRKG